MWWVQLIIGLSGAAAGAAGATGGSVWLEHRRGKRRLRAAAVMLHEEIGRRLWALYVDKKRPGIGVPLKGGAPINDPLTDNVWREYKPALAELAPDELPTIDVAYAMQDLYRDYDREERAARIEGESLLEYSEAAYRLVAKWAGLSSYTEDAIRRGRLIFAEDEVES